MALPIDSPETKSITTYINRLLIMVVGFETELISLLNYNSFPQYVSKIKPISASDFSQFQKNKSIPASSISQFQKIKEQPALNLIKGRLNYDFMQNI